MCEYSKQEFVGGLQSLGQVLVILLVWPSYVSHTSTKFHFVAAGLTPWRSLGKGYRTFVRS